MATKTNRGSRGPQVTATKAAAAEQTAAAAKEYELALHHLQERTHADAVPAVWTPLRRGTAVAYSRT